jgi:hypothetical protein
MSITWNGTRLGSRILMAAAYHIVLSKGGHDNLSIHDGTWHAVGLLKRLAEEVQAEERS